MNNYEPYYYSILQIKDNLHNIKLQLESDNNRDKRLIYLIRAEEELKKALMKGTIYR